MTARLELISDLVLLDAATCFRQSPRRIRARIQRKGGNAGLVLNPLRIHAWLIAARRSPLAAVEAALTPQKANQ